MIVSVIATAPDGVTREPATSYFPHLWKISFDKTGLGPASSQQEHVGVTASSSVSISSDGGGNAARTEAKHAQAHFE